MSTSGIADLYAYPASYPLVRVVASDSMNPLFSLTVHADAFAYACPGICLGMPRHMPGHA